MGIDKFSLNDALRYFFCGVTFMLSFARGYGWNLSNLGALSTASVTGISLVALTTGAVTYSVYRALIYVYLSRIAQRVSKFVAAWDKWKISFILPTNVPDAEFNLDQWRWNYGVPDGDKKKTASVKLAEWGSQIHLCYTSATAVWIGSLSGALSNDPQSRPCIDCGLMIVAAIFIIAGASSHLRLKDIETRLRNLSETEQSSAPNVGAAATLDNSKLVEGPNR